MKRKKTPVGIYIDLVCSECKLKGIRCNHMSPTILQWIGNKVNQSDKIISDMTESDK